MKIVNLIIIGCALILLFVGCANIKIKPQTIEVSEIVDFTDTLIAKPNPEEAISLLNLNNNIWNGASFRYLSITNVSYNPMFETKINAEFELLGNQFKRKDIVKKFNSDISKIITDASKEKIGKDNSSVYYPVVLELNRLSKSQATTKVLLIYSDLMENTIEMSFYDKAKINLIKTNPDLIKKYFDSQVELQNINGIKIYLIYQPINTVDDEIYRIVSSYYKKLFESKGATVEITASL